MAYLNIMLYLNITSTYQGQKWKELDFTFQLLFLKLRTSGKEKEACIQDLDYWFIKEKKGNNRNMIENVSHCYK